MTSFLRHHKDYIAENTASKWRHKNLPFSITSLSKILVSLLPFGMLNEEIGPRSPNCEADVLTTTPPRHQFAFLKPNFVRNHITHISEKLKIGNEMTGSYDIRIRDLPISLFWNRYWKSNIGRYSLIIVKFEFAYRPIFKRSNICGLIYRSFSNQNAC